MTLRAGQAGESRAAGGGRNLFGTPVVRGTRPAGGRVMIDLLLANESLGDLLREDNVIPIIAMGGGFIIAITAIVFVNVRSMVVSRNQEATKREIAAYVADGTLPADQAVRIIEAGAEKEEA
jgi:hypothetical protein